LAYYFYTENILRAKGFFLAGVAVNAAILFGCASLAAPKIEPSDFQILTGAKWNGILTYLDYGNGQKTSIASTLSVTQSTEDKLKWTFDYQYPDEPKANQKSEVLLSADGRTVDGARVVEKIYLPDNTLKLTTEKDGKDNQKTAVLRYTYLLSATKFSIRKQVKLEGMGGFFERNEYSWKR
jgi:hypothetical protein